MLTKTQPDRLRQALAEAGITLDATFVPFSASRHAKRAPKLADLKINWTVTILHNGRKVLTTDYSEGIGHVRPYRNGTKVNTARPTLDDADEIRRQCETGKRSSLPGRFLSTITTPINPPTVDSVMYCLLLDAAVLNYWTYESWAAGLGFDPDSRSGETVYRTCLASALQLLNGLGPEVLADLQVAAEDY